MIYHGITHDLPPFGHRPCAKCGCESISLKYQCRDQDGEFDECMRHQCDTCGYIWRTQTKDMSET